MNLENPHRILVVEDLFLVANELEETLKENGFLVDIAGNVKDALLVIENNLPKVAILDINLGAEKVFPVAERLHDCQVPFIFATGHHDGSIMPERFRHIRVVEKPYSFADVAEILKKLCSCLRP